MTKLTPPIGVALYILTLASSTAEDLPTPPAQTKVRSLAFTGNSLISNERVASAIGTQITYPIPVDGISVHPAELRQALSAILSVYQDSGFDGIAVYVDPTNIKSANPLRFADDRVVILIKEATVGEVQFLHRTRKKKGFGREQVDGDAPTSDVSRLWKKLFSGLSGGPLRKKELDRRIKVLERHPNRSAAAVIRPPKENAGKNSELGGVVDLEMRVVDAAPQTVVLSTSDAGLEDGADIPFSIALLHNNLLGRDDRLTVHFSGPADGKLADNFSTYVSYDQPLWDLRWRNQTYGTYNQFQTSDVLGPDTAFIGEGFLVANQTSWAAWQNKNWGVDLFAGVGFQGSEVKSPFGNDTDFNLLDVKVGTTLYRSTSTWSGSVSVEVLQDLTGLFSLSDQTDFDNSRLGSSPDFFATRFRGSQTWQPASWLRFTQSFSAQWTDERLPGARQFSFGGINSVRGYEDLEVRGDTGVYLVSEPSIRLNSIVPQLDSASLYVDWVPVFLDVGVANLVDPFVGEDVSTTILGVGFGARLYFKQLLSMRVFWGHALRDAGLGRETDSGDSNLHFDISIRY